MRNKFQIRFLDRRLSSYKEVGSRLNLSPPHYEMIKLRFSFFLFGCGTSEKINISLWNKWK